MARLIAAGFGAAADPALGYFFVNSSDQASIGWIEKKPEGSKVLFDRNSIVGPMSRFQWSEGDPKIGNISRMPASMRGRAKDLPGAG